MSYYDRGLGPGNATASIIRFNEAKRMEQEGGFDYDPTNPSTHYSPSDATTLAQCDQARRIILRELNRKYQRIENDLSVDKDEEEIRQLNKEMNSLVKLKKEWDFRARQLTEFKSRPNQRFEDAGTEGDLGIHDFFYFGRAKDLPEYTAKQKKLIGEKEAREEDKFFLLDLLKEEEEASEQEGGEIEIKDGTVYLSKKIHSNKFRDRLKEHLDAYYYGFVKEVPYEDLSDQEEHIAGPQWSLKSIAIDHHVPTVEEIHELIVQHDQLVKEFDAEGIDVDDKSR